MAPLDRDPQALVRVDRAVARVAAHVERLVAATRWRNRCRRPRPRPPSLPAGCRRAERATSSTICAHCGARSSRHLPTAGCRRSSSRRRVTAASRRSAWHEQPFFSLLRQWYLLYASYLRELAALAPLPEPEKRRLAFATRQYVDAIAPTNFPATNPDVLRKADGDRGREPRAGVAQSRGGRAQGPHHDDGRGRVRSRAQPRGDAGQRGLPQRADRAHPVRRHHAEGRQAADRDGAAVHQQVLHPRSHAGELVRRARRRAGPHGVHGVVAQRAARSSAR